MRTAVCLAVGLAIVAIPPPEGVEPEGWRTLAIFATVIAGFVLRPFPMGPTVLFGVVTCSATRSLELDRALSGYGEKVVWLVVGAFLLAGTVRDTGLDRRIALLPVRTHGRSLLGVAYAQAAAELLLGPIVPSNTARGERILTAVFALLILLWSAKAWGPLVGLPLKPDTTLVTLLGVCVLLATGVQPWKRMTEDAAAWDTLIWLGGLLTMAHALEDRGVVDWFAASARTWFAGSPVLVTAIGLALVYFYSMVAFSMLTAHISAMAGAFLLVCLGAGVPALLAVPLFAAFSSLCACTTNYSTGPVILYFGLGYVPASSWFRVGFLVSLFHLAVWIPAGLLWWRFLGWW
jgi:di/tricarboxylate transporter